MTELSEPHDDDQQPLFRDTPIRTRCPSCLSQTISDVVLKAEYSTIVLSALLFLVLPNILNIVAMMFAFVLTSVKKHRCSVCQFQLGTDGKFMYFLHDKVYSFNVGKSGIIVSKKILVSVGLTALLMAILVIIGLTAPNRHLVFTKQSWAEFKSECRMGDEDSNQERCQQKYQHKSFADWTGFVMKVKDNRESYSRFYESEITIYLKMTPQINQHQPEILLEFDRLSVISTEAKIVKMHHGDQIRFNATFGSFVSRGSAITMYVSNFQLTGERRELVDYIPLSSSGYKRLRKNK